MKKGEVLQAWGTIYPGGLPLFRLRSRRNVPCGVRAAMRLTMPTWGGSAVLRELSDFKGDELVTRVLAILDELRPLHVSLVGGDPLVRYRELEKLIPQIEARGIHTQVVTSAFRVIPRSGASTSG